MEANEVRELDAALRLRFDLFLMRCFLTVNPGAIFWTIGISSIWHTWPSAL
jgi:hypothetical protein